MKFADVHVHFYPDFIRENPEKWACENGEIYWGKLVGKRPDGKKSLQSFFGENEFISLMEDAKIERAIVQSWYWERLESCRFLNGEILKFVKKFPQKLSAFAAIQIALEPDLRGAVKRAKDEGFWGIGEIHDGVQNFSFASKKFEIFANTCAEEEMPVCVHATERTPRKYLGKVDTENFEILNAVKKFSETKFILAHWFGGEILKPEIEKLPDNVFLDSAAHPLLYKNFHWKIFLGKFHARALFGSDFPLRVYPKSALDADFKRLADEARENVPPEFCEEFFHKNFKKLFSSQL